jgi:ribonuclease-3
VEEGLEILEQTLEFKFQNRNLLKEALTHRSYLNEDPKWPFSHNERLEFLGDAVLEMIVTEALLERFPEKAEGDLTFLRAALVKNQTLAVIAKELCLQRFLRISRGELTCTSQVREVVLADVVEAIIGAIYRDGGYIAAQRFVKKQILGKITETIKRGIRDPKSLLKEKLEAHFRETPIYKVVKETGPDHKKFFTVAVFIGNQKIGQGEGNSKKEAERGAAENALTN